MVRTKVGMPLILNKLYTSLLPVILALQFAFLPVENAKILAVETVTGRSHWNVVSSILRVLSDNGHHVVVFTPTTDGDRENYTEIDTSDAFPRRLLNMNAVEILRKWRHPVSMMNFLRVASRGGCDIIYGNDRLNGIMEEYGKFDFDLVITETLGIDCVSYLAAKLNLPLIHVISSPMITFAERSTLGYVPNPAVISNLLTDHSIPKTFFQRLSNTALLAYSILTVNYNEWINAFTDPQPYDLITNPVRPSLVFLNSHFISEASRPFPPNVVQVGGIHLKPVKSIPNDVLEFIENSSHGVILFTFGSIIKASTLPENIINMFKETFAQVPYRILWKYEGEMENQPENVMIRKWFPQRDILMHHNVKLFISHGGMSAVYETVDAGVPVLGFPMFYDQPKNIANLVDSGMAISMELLSLNKDELLKNVLKLITNENYTRNAKAVSDRFKDRPITPEQSVLYWTEYIIRHKGAPHLKPCALSLTWYQYFLLDVIAVLLIFVSISLFITYKVLKTIYDCIIILLATSLSIKIKTKCKYRK